VLIFKGMPTAALRFATGGDETKWVAGRPFWDHATVQVDDLRGVLGVVFQKDSI
jgi:hypothetical protein